INTLIVRANVGSDPAFNDLVARVREASIGAFAHQDLPFEYLVELLEPDRKVSHTPFTQITFGLQDAPRPLSLADTVAEPFDIGSGMYEYEVCITLTLNAGRLDGLFIYNGDLYDAASGHRMLG